MSATTPGPPRPGLRERKKQMTRKAILDSAARLFGQHGYDGVTIAEIADDANVAVNTLFSYFDSKEDLYFSGETEIRDAFVAAVTDRRAGVSALDAVRAFLKDLARQQTDGRAGIEAFRSDFCAVPQLHARMLRMYERFEEALAEVLAAETSMSAGRLAPRLAAAQLVSLLRLIATEETPKAAQAGHANERSEALVVLIDESADLLADGLSGFAIRQRRAVPVGQHESLTSAAELPLPEQRANANASGMDAS